MQSQYNNQETKYLTEFYHLPEFKGLEGYKKNGGYKDLEKACFLKGVIEFFNPNSSIDEEFIKALENKPPNLFPFENKVFDFNTGYWRLRTKEDYFNFTTDDKILKLAVENRKTIEDYITS